MRSQPAKPGSRWLLHSEAAFGIALPLPARNRRQFGCGCSSVVEHDLAKVGVEGSSPFARSKNFHLSSDFRHGRCKAALSFCFGEARGKQPSSISCFSLVRARSAPPPSSRYDTQRSSSRTARSAPPLRKAAPARAPEPTGATSAERLQRAIGPENFDAGAGQRVDVKERLLACTLSGLA